MASRKNKVFKKAALLATASSACRETDPGRSRKLFEQSESERRKLAKRKKTQK